MKRRDFLKRTGQAALLAAVPIAMVAASNKSGLSILTDATSGTPPPKLTSRGVRFIEQTHVPCGVPKRTHSYLDLVGNKSPVIK